MNNAPYDASPGQVDCFLCDEPATQEVVLTITLETGIERVYPMCDRHATETRDSFKPELDAA